MIEQPSIPQSTAGLVLNDMINGNFRTGNSNHDRLIKESGIIEHAAACVATAREHKIPIFWIRVERRPDHADVICPVTDTFLAGGRKGPHVIVRGSFEAANVDELPIQPEDQVIVKPRMNPFIGTDLDLQLRVRRIDTILFGGYSTNFGVESGVRTARDLGYNVVVLSDCCYNVNKELHEWCLTKILPNFARVLTSDQAWKLLA